MDGEYTREEQIEMKRLAKEIGVREEVLDVIEQWVLEGVRWTKKCEELLFLS